MTTFRTTASQLEPGDAFYALDTTWHLVAGVRRTGTTVIVRTTAGRRFEYGLNEKVEVR